MMHKYGEALDFIHGSQSSSSMLTNVAACLEGGREDAIPRLKSLARNQAQAGHLFRVLGITDFDEAAFNLIEEALSLGRWWHQRA